MTKAYLIVQREIDRDLVYLAGSANERDSLTRPGMYYRISPIYGAVPEETMLPDLGKHLFAGFFCYERAFARLGDIINSLPKQHRCNLWFSYGLASTILFSPEPAIFDHVKTTYGERLRAMERWRIDQHVLTIDQPWFCKPAELCTADFQLSDFGELDYDERSVLEELQHCLNEVVRQSAQFIPSELALIRGLRAHVDEFIAQLKLLGRDGFSTEALKGDVAAAETAIARRKRVNAITDCLVQINSSLSYVVSQAFGGASPILQRPCLYHAHSLLGIGTAYCALAAFSRSVARVFEDYPVYETIRTKFEHVKGIDVFRSLKDFDPQRWDEPHAQIDTHIEKSARVPERPHLVFYSGRLGFQEAHFSVSAAMQALSGADTVRWSLMTLSHELMHSHVRDILAAIFSSADPTQLSASDFRAHCVRYERFLRDGFSKCNPGLRDCLRFAIFNYCRFRVAFDTAASAPAPVDGGDRTVHGNVHDLRPEEMRRALATYYKDINEIIVHVLDYHYFFNGKSALYIDVLWESWATVPAVLVNLEHYLLRTLAAISTTEVGIPTERFQSSFRALRERLQRLTNARPPNVLLAQACR